MSADIIPLPRPFKPHAIEPTETLLFGEAGEFVPISDLSRPWDGPTRRHFGNREPTGEAMFNITRPEDQRAQDNIKRLAREARNVFDAGHVCPSLLRAKAGHADGIAQALRSLAAEVKALGATKQGNTFETAADYVEMASAELEAPFIPEGA